MFFPLLRMVETFHKLHTLPSCRFEYLGMSTWQRHVPVGGHVRFSDRRAITEHINLCKWIKTFSKCILPLYDNIFTFRKRICGLKPMIWCCLSHNISDRFLNKKIILIRLCCEIRILCIAYTLTCNIVLTYYLGIIYMYVRTRRHNFKNANDISHPENLSILQLTKFNCRL